MNTIYTFWEGKMPEYLKSCLDTWKFPFVILNYNNLAQFTDKIPEKVKQLSLPKIADYVRVHVLRDNGGYWLDTDTIMLSDKLPDECILGNNTTRENSVGYLNAKEPNEDFFTTWAAFQDWKLNRLPNMSKDVSPWNVMGNAFTDYYLKEHKEIVLGNREKTFPETYMINGNIPRPAKYQKFYFGSNFTLNDVKEKTNMLMLHNSWTPDWYKKLSKEQALLQKCTLSNILRELTQK
jgi:hypothetical protein